MSCFVEHPVDKVLHEFSSDDRRQLKNISKSEIAQTLRKIIKVYSPA